MFETLERRKLLTVAVALPAYASFDAATQRLTISGSTGADTFTSYSLYNTRELWRGDSKVVSWTVGDVASVVVDAGAGNDTVTLFLDSNVPTTVLGGSGNDTLTMGVGSDSISGGDGDDVIDAGFGNDTMIGAGGKDTLMAGGGNDDFQGGAQRDVLDSAGCDLNLNISQDTSGLSSQPGVVANDRVGYCWDYLDNVQGDIENFILGIGNDVFAGGSVDNYVDGGTGNDNLDGGSGNDTLIGGDGIDILSGVSGNDTFFAHDDTTTLAIDVITGGSGDDVLGDTADLLDLVAL